MAAPEDPMLWVQGGIDLVKSVGDVFSDIFGGSSDKESESESSEMSNT